MKNIALLLPNLHSGGSERIAARLSEALSEKYKVFLVLFDDSDMSYAYGGTLVNLKLPSTKGKAGKMVNLIKRIRAFRSFVKKEKIDVCCSFTSAADYVNAFSKAKCKRLVSCRGAAFLEKNTWLYHKMCKASDGILFNSEGMKDIYLKEYPRDKQKAYVLYNLFDTKSILQKAQENLPKEFEGFFATHRVVTTVARFSQEKGHWNLIKAFEILKEKVPDAGLLFVGHMGAFEEKVRSMAKASPYSEDIKFAGYSDNPFKFCANSAVYALSSIKEGFPNSLVEAMACGIPVVATDCRTGPGEILFEKPQAINETFKVADYGVITPAFTDEIDFDNNNKKREHTQFALALEKVLTDKALAEELAEKGKTRALEFDKEKINSKYISLMERL